MRTRVAVVYGGRSGEHEVSLVSAESVMAAMNPERYGVNSFIRGHNHFAQRSKRETNHIHARHDQLSI